MISNISVNSEEEDPVFQFAPKHFQAKFVVATADYLSRKRRLGFTDQWYNDPETIPVSGDLFSRRIRGMFSLLLFVVTPSLTQISGDTARS